VEIHLVNHVQLIDCFISPLSFIMGDRFKNRKPSTKWNFG